MFDVVIIMVPSIAMVIFTIVTIAVFTAISHIPQK